MELKQINTYINTRKEVEQLEATLKSAKERLDIAEKELVMFMENEGLQNFKTADGNMVYTREQLYVRIEENKEQDLFAWFESQHMGELIKQSIPNATLRSMAKDQEIPFIIVNRETKIGFRKG